MRAQQAGKKNIRILTAEEGRKASGFYENLRTASKGMRRSDRSCCLFIE